ncbi:uncharacterized protein LOC135167021 [Diachasmimorpha longicaudata]|uniref:uncharacterized protein LOC135167021 n=1 Tax=Diachasmimorpha longicaudata TaxID=58733 RepID=UPI0030B90223
MAEALMISLKELVGVAADTEEEDGVLDQLKLSAVSSLPVGCQERQIRKLSFAELFGEDGVVDTLLLWKIEFALPTVKVARAFDPEASGLSDDEFHNCKATMLRWPFCRALIISPPVLVNRIWGSKIEVQQFLDLLKPVRHLFVSASEADKTLKQGRLKRERPPSEEGQEEDDRPVKRSSLAALEKRMTSLFATLLDKLEEKDIQPREDSGDARQDKENLSDSPSEVEEDMSEEEEPSTLHPLFQEPTVENTGDSVFLDPQVKECDPLIPEPDSALKAQGISCQKLNSAAWSRIRYKEVQKRLQAAPVFDTLKINSELRSIAPKTSTQSLLGRFDSMTGTFAHGLMLQRKRLSEALDSLLKKHPQVKNDVKALFNKDSGVQSVSDDLLHFTCARRAEIFELRRNPFKALDPGLAAKLAEIPPSESHLFQQKQLSECRTQNGGVKKIFAQSKEFFREQLPSFPLKEASNNYRARNNTTFTPHASRGRPRPAHPPSRKSGVPGGGKDRLPKAEAPKRHQRRRA